MEEAFRFADFQMPPPREVSELERGALVRSSMARIWDTGGELTVVSEPTLNSHQPGQGALPQDLWMLLLVRMVTRAAAENKDIVENEQTMDVIESLSREDRIRQVLFDYILTDFPSRFVYLLIHRRLRLIILIFLRERLAIIWMNEEWYNDRLRKSKDPEYVSQFTGFFSIDTNASTAGEL